MSVSRSFLLPFREPGLVPGSFFFGGLGYPSRVKRFPSFATALAVLAALGTGCARRSKPAESFPNAPVVLISVDTLRSDHLPFYGYAGVETPALSALREDSILFSNAWSQVPLTLPSHASILTGRLPGDHGIHDNLGYLLRKDVPTIAELLKKQGYATGAAISCYVLKAVSGIGRGFDLYDDDVDSAEGRLSLGRVQRAGPETESRLEKWVAERKDGEPFFAFLHLYEPHTPYEPPEPFKSRYAKVPYDGEIATSDALVGRFLAVLKQRGIYDRALIVFLSDHGEGLGEHGEAEHGMFLYREALQVPLLVKLPGSRRANTSVASAVPLTDVFTTIGLAAGVPGFVPPAETESLLAVTSAIAAAPAPFGDFFPPNPLRLERPRLRSRGAVALHRGAEARDLRSGSGPGRDGQPDRGAPERPARPPGRPPEEAPALERAGRRRPRGAEEAGVARLSQRGAVVVSGDARRPKGPDRHVRDAPEGDG